MSQMLGLFFVGLSENALEISISLSFLVKNKTCFEFTSGTKYERAKNNLLEKKL